MTISNKTNICLGLLISLVSGMHAEDIKINKVDLDMFKLYILAGIRQNCQTDPVTHQQAPLCQTMHALVKGVDNLNKKGGVSFKDIILPIVHALKKDIQTTEKSMMKNDQSRVVVTVNMQKDTELLAMINSLIYRLESDAVCSDEEIAEEFEKIKAKYDNRSNNQ